MEIKIHKTRQKYVITMKDNPDLIVGTIFGNKLNEDIDSFVISVAGGYNVGYFLKSIFNVALLTPNDEFNRTLAKYMREGKEWDESLNYLFNLAEGESEERDGLIDSLQMNKFEGES